MVAGREAPAGQTAGSAHSSSIAPHAHRSPASRSDVLAALGEAATAVCFHSMRAIDPTFTPGSGWHRLGQWSPGSARDRQSMREAAFACCVVVLYRGGERIPALDLLKRKPPSGWLVCRDLYTAPKWYACLFDDESMQRETMRLLHARLERENGGVRLYGGIELEDRGRQEWRQAWLCTPTPDRARDILLGMVERQGGAP